MPKRTDIKSILIIGAGPIVIGQACEFDYSGAQACKALREEGVSVVLVNSNPATIMTDEGVADIAAIEGLLDEGTACVIVGYPNFFGRPDDVAAAASPSSASASAFSSACVMQICHSLLAMRLLAAGRVYCQNF